MKMPEFLAIGFVAFLVTVLLVGMPIIKVLTSLTQNSTQATDDAHVAKCPSGQTMMIGLVEGGLPHDKKLLFCANPDNSVVVTVVPR